MPNLLLLIAQICIIVGAARVVGLAFRKIQQPQVVGEMVAGILLGPSLLGWVAPGLFALIFPPQSLGFLNALSQVGLVVFMFLVGLELDSKLLASHRHIAVLTSHISIVVPFFLGALLALYLYPRLSDDSVTFTSFALFMGAAMSVTAFPVLARILTERNLVGTRVGTIAIACAAVDDITAWCILAGIIIVVRSGSEQMPFWVTLFGAALYIGFMFGITRRALQPLYNSYRRAGRLSQDVVAILLLLALASAWTTEWLGIHALFGAFLMGVVTPKDKDFARDVKDRLEPMAVILLLPLFFALTGLRTSIEFVSGAEMWFYCGAIILVAIVGKLGGSMFSAYMSGMHWRESVAIGILMNTRGLMELVILNIGLEIGVISESLFSMMVLMALVTTFMTTPLLHWVYTPRLAQQEKMAGGK